MMSDLPGGYPDAHAPLTTSSVEDDLKQIVAWYGPNKYIEKHLNDNMPISAESLAAAYSGRNPQMKNYIFLPFVSGDGWWFRLAKLVRMEMNTAYTVYSMDRYSLEPAPEDTQPRTVHHRTETGSESLSRFSLGAQARHDFFKRPEGKEQMKNDIKTIISGSWITCRQLIANAALGAKQYYRELERQKGRPFNKILDAMQDEVRLFGIISKDDQAIYKLKAYIETFTKEENIKFDMMVFNKGVLDFIALSGAFENKAGFIRGTDTMNDRLTKAGESMKGIFPGYTLWEDEHMALQNVNKDEIESFTRIVTIGRYFMIDGSDFGKRNKDYDAIKQNSVEHISLDIDDWKEFTITKAIDGSLRWKDDGTLTSDVQGVIDNIEGLLHRLGAKLEDIELIDPYIWKDDNYKEKDNYGNELNNVNNNGLHVIKHWGDMHNHYFTKEQTFAWGERFKTNIIQKKEFTDKDQTNMNELKSLKDRLYDVDQIDERFEGMFFAITADPRNRTDPTKPFGDTPNNNLNFNNISLKANIYGSVEIPYIERDLSSQIKKTSSNGKPGSALPNGAMYIIDQKTKTRHYVWTVQSDSYPEIIDIDIENNKLFRDDQGRFTRSLRGLQKLQDIGFEIPSFNAFYKDLDGKTHTYMYSGLNQQYFLAPIDRFGPVDENGEAYNWYENDVESENTSLYIQIAKYLSDTIIRLVEQGKQVNRDNNGRVETVRERDYTDAELINIMEGAIDSNKFTKIIQNEIFTSKAPRLVSAPSLPFGFSNITSLRYLGSLHSKKDYRGWQEDILKTCYDGVKSLDKLAKILMRTSPDCEFLIEKLVPYFMESVDRDTNILNSLLSNIWDHAKEPLWCKIPKYGELKLSNGSKFKTYFTEKFPSLLLDGNGRTEMNNNSDDDEQMLASRLLSTITDADGLKLVSKKNINIVVSTTDALEIYSLVFKNEGLGGVYINMFSQYSMNTYEYNKFIDKFNNSLTSQLLKLYVSKVWNIQVNNVTFGDLLLSLLHDNMENSTVKDGNLLAYIIANQLRILLNFQTQEQTRSSSEEGLVAYIKKAKESAMKSYNENIKKNQKRQAIEGKDKSNKLERKILDGSREYINTRLSISKNIWEFMSNKLNASIANENVDDLINIYGLIVRPSNPINNTTALATNFLQLSAPTDFADAPTFIRVFYEGFEDKKPVEYLSDHYNQLKHARGQQNNRLNGNGLTNTIFGNAHLIANRNINNNSTKLSSKDQYRLDQVNSFSEFDREPTEYYGKELMETSDGPFYTLDEDLDSVVDREGKSIGETMNISKKKWLIWRFNTIIEEINDDVIKMACLTMCLTRVTKDSLYNWLKENLPVPDCCFVICQPWVQIKTSCVLAAKAGPDTAEMGYNYEDCVIQFNGNSKRWSVHYTIWLNCVIYNIRGLITIPDIKLEQYMGGMDDTVNDDPIDYNPENIDLSMMKSCFIYSCGANFTRQDALTKANPLPLPGMYDIKSLPYNLSNNNNGFDNSKLLLPSTLFYEYIWGHSQMNNTRTADYSSYLTMKDSTYIPGLMLYCDQRTYEEQTRSFSKKHRGTGHLDGIEPPLKNMLNGKIEVINNKKYH